MTEKPRFIYRAKRDEENPYFQHRRATAQDRTLTFEARGMLSYLLSQPDTWKVQPKDLEQQCKKSVVYRILGELIEHGYIDRQQERDDKKKIIAWHYIVHEEPIVKNLLPKKQEVALPEVEKLEVENQDIRDKRVLETKELRDTSAENPANGAPPEKHETIAEFVETLEIDDLANTGNTPPDDLPQDDKPPKKQRARDPVYDAIAEVWPKAENGMIVCVKSMVLGTAKRGIWKDCNFDKPATAEEILRFGQWCKSNKKGMANQPPIIQNWFYEFRRHEAAKQKIPAAAAGFDLSQWQPVTFNPDESYGE